MSDLLLDLGELQQLSAELAAIARDFSGSDALSGTVAEATGHDRLSGRVNEFASNWAVHRTQMLHDIETLQQYLQDLTDGFTKLDGQLAQALQSDGSAAAAS
ncbi:MAG TPA: hypothetical protein VGC45_11940 [Gryllotalpicola sp.]